MKMTDTNVYTNIILLSNDWKGYHRKALTEELAAELCSWSNVVLVQLPVSLIVHIFTSFRRKIIGLIKGNYKTQKLSDKSYIYSPVILFHYLVWNKSRIFFKIDSWFLKKQIRKFIKRNFNSQKTILWYYFPYLKNFAEEFKADINVYDQYDIYHLSLDGTINNDLKNMNEKLIALSDMVICTTEYLFEISKRINKCSYYVTNGNNFNLLSSHGIDHKNLDLPVIKGKTIGYLGGIRDWIDFSLVNHVITELPNVNFLFVGPVYQTAKEELKKLLKYKNFKWIDYVQPSELPSVMKNFHAGIIPFRNTEFFKSVFPNKFFEYLASGLPVISTNLPELRKYKEIIGFSYNKDDFLDFCKKALDGRFDKYRLEYLNLSEENSWSNKAKEISGYLKKYI